MKEYKYKINGNLYNVVIGDIEDNIAHVEVNGTHYTVEMEKKPKAAAAPKPVARPVAKPAAAPAPAASAPASKPAAGKSGVKSPLPGVILDIKVKEGDEVKKGQTVIILEAMKMENSINADKDGKVTAINVSKGESVLEGTDLIIIE
jgi:biotin carboxyl carrier protein